jgi:hypothetical protein
VLRRACSSHDVLARRNDHLIGPEERYRVAMARQ